MASVNQAGIGSSSETTMKAYSEACNTLRHYSVASMTVRLASIAQGLGIVLGWAVAFYQHASFCILFFLPVAGMAFTLLLYRFNLGYFNAAMLFLSEASRIEERFMEEGVRPISAYKLMHQTKYRSLWAKIFTLNAPFALIGSLFLALLILTLLARSLAFLCPQTFIH